MTSSIASRLLEGARAVLCAFLCLQLSACSFMFVSGPPDDHRARSRIDCSKGRGWPVTDTVFGGLWVTEAALVGAGAFDREQPAEKRMSPGERAGLAAVFAGLAALQGFSAYYGYRRSSQCREALAQLDARGGMPEPLPEPGWLVLTRDGQSFVVAPSDASVAISTTSGEERLRLADLSWLVGDGQKRARTKQARVRDGALRPEPLALQRITRSGRKPLQLRAADIAFFLNTNLRQESGSLRVEDIGNTTRVSYGYREPSALNGAFDVDLLPDRWAGQVLLSNANYAAQMSSQDPLKVGVSANGSVPPNQTVEAELRLGFDRGSVSVTRALPDFHPAGDSMSALLLDFGTPFTNGETTIHGQGTVLLYLAAPQVDTVGAGLVRIQRTLSNVLSLPLAVELDRAPRTSIALAPPDPAAEPSGAIPPGTGDWQGEFVGRGGLTVTVRNASPTPVVVRVRDNQHGIVAAQVAVAANADATVRLGGGQFDVLMRASLGGSFRYFKGQPISVPPGTIGRAVLSVGVSGGGEGLSEIDAKEFEAL